MSVAAVEKKGKDAPKRQPRSNTCADFGDHYKQAAAKADSSPAARNLFLEQSRLAYRQALELDPKCLKAYLGLGELYQSREQYDRAAETYQKGLKELPEAHALWFAQGMFHARRLQWDSALASLRKAVEGKPENPQYVNALGFCLTHVGRYDESLVCFKQVMGEAKAHYNIARMLHHLKKDVESKEHLQLALRAKPDLSGARELLAELEGNHASNPVVAVSFEENIDVR